MRVIHVLRKPLSEGTVAGNVLKHGCGGINIDASRVGTDDNLNGGAYAKNASERHDGAENWRYKRGGAGRASLPGDTREGADAGMFQPGSTAPSNFVQPTGRWPANVILQHLDGCRCDGTKKVGSGRFVAHDAVVRKSTMMDPGKGWNGNSLDNSKKNAPNSYDKESVANWICVEGCPVARLDEQTADRLHLAGNVNNNGTGDGKNYEASAYHISYEGRADRDQSRRDTTTGASRFFKQVGGKTDE